MVKLDVREEEEEDGGTVKERELAGWMEVAVVHRPRTKWMCTMRIRRRDDGGDRPG